MQKGIVVKNHIYDKIYYYQGPPFKTITDSISTAPMAPVLSCMGSHEAKLEQRKIVYTYLVCTTIIKAVLYGVAAPTMIIYYGVMYMTNRKKVFARSFIPGCGFQIIHEYFNYESPINTCCNI